MKKTESRMESASHSFHGNKRRISKNEKNSTTSTFRKFNKISYRRVNRSIADASAVAAAVADADVAATDAYTNESFQGGAADRQEKDGNGNALLHNNNINNNNNNKQNVPKISSISSICSPPQQCQSFFVAQESATKKQNCNNYNNYNSSISNSSNPSINIAVPLANASTSQSWYKNEDKRAPSIFRNNSSSRNRNNSSSRNSNNYSSKNYSSINSRNIGCEEMKISSSQNTKQFLPNERNSNSQKNYNYKRSSDSDNSGGGEGGDAIFTSFIHSAAYSSSSKPHYVNNTANNHDQCLKSPVEKNNGNNNNIFVVNPPVRDIVKNNNIMNPSCTTTTTNKRTKKFNHLMSYENDHSREDKGGAKNPQFNENAIINATALPRNFSHKSSSANAFSGYISRRCGDECVDEQDGKRAQNLSVFHSVELAQGTQSKHKDSSDTERKWNMSTSSSDCVSTKTNEQHYKNDFGSNLTWRESGVSYSGKVPAENSAQESFFVESSSAVTVKSDSASRPAGAESFATKRQNGSPELNLDHIDSCSESLSSTLSNPLKNELWDLASRNQKGNSFDACRASSREELVHAPGNLVHECKREAEKCSSRALLLSGSNNVVSLSAHSIDQPGSELHLGGGKCDGECQKSAFVGDVVKKEVIPDIPQIDKLNAFRIPRKRNAAKSCSRSLEDWEDVEATKIGEGVEANSCDTHLCRAHALISGDNRRSSISVTERPFRRRTVESIWKTTSYYDEEMAWRESSSQEEQQGLAGNGDISCNYFRSLPPAPPMPALPANGRWTFDDETRVLLGKFTDLTSLRISQEDEEFMLRMMERTDITVVSEGLISGSTVDEMRWWLSTLGGTACNEVHHRFRVFKRILERRGDIPESEMDPTNEIPTRSHVVTYKEYHTSKSLRMNDFVRYLNARKEHLVNIAQRRKRAGLKDGSNPNNPEEDQRYRIPMQEEFSYVDVYGNRQSFNCVDTVLYLLDYDMIRLAPTFLTEFLANFKVPGLLPGGAHCMMNSVSSVGRPFMGPNLYISPPEGFTHFHQDGHGTVDSGHQCLTGFNEVILLRRLTEARKSHALLLLQGNTVTAYNALYGLPHAESNRDLPRWPTSQSIQECKKMNYYPSVFVLQPGQFVHINKGRLHAFRKLSPSYLDQNDCHAVLRREIWRIHGLKDTEQLCVSIAWDWMFRGVTSDGANRELSSVLECAELNRRHRVQSLGIPETSLLRMARHVIALYRTSVSSPDVRGDKMIGTDYKIKRLGFVPEPLEIMKGIHPSLDVVVRGHGAALDCARRALTAQVMFSTKPNAWENPSSFPLDPYGSGFFCKFCFEELSNFYFHCDGCERLLGKDFDICMKCHNKGKHRFMVQMHLHLTNRDSTFNHTGDMSFKRRSSCPCKKGQVCQFCDFCCACSCTCHQKFTLHCRFMTMDEEFSLLHEVDDIVGSNRIKYFDETTSRLNHFRLSGDISFEHNAK